MRQIWFVLNLLDLRFLQILSNTWIAILPEYIVWWTKLEKQESLEK